MRGISWLIRLAILVTFVVSVGCASSPAAPLKPAESKPAESKAAEAKPAAQSEAKPAEAPAAKGEPVHIRIAVQPGTQVWPIQVIEKLGLDKKYNFILDKKEYASPTAKVTAFKTGEVDIAPNSWLPTVQARVQGTKMFTVFSMYGVTNDVLVRKDSPYQTLRDLKGKKIGNFGGPSAVTAAILRIGAIKDYGFDPWKDAKIQEGAAPLLASLLEKGELDAALLQDPQVTMMLASGKFRSIARLDELYQKATGDRITVLGIAAMEPFAKEHPAVVTNFIRAYIEAVKYMRTNDQIWQDFAKELKIDTPEGVKLLMDRTRNGFFTEWDDKMVAAHKRFAKAAIDIIGPDFLPSVPDDAFTTEYVPRDMQ